MTIAGSPPDKATLERLNVQLASHRHLDTAKLVVHTFKQDNGIDLGLIKTEMQQDLYRNSVSLLESKNAKIQQLEDIIRAEKNAQSMQIERLSEYDQVRKELQAQYPELRNVLITHGKSKFDGDEVTAGVAAMPDDMLIVYLDARKPVNTETRMRIRNWLKVRLKLAHVYVVSKKFD